MTFQLKQISKEEASSLLYPYHYLTSESKGFRSGTNYGAFVDNKLLAVCIFNCPSVPELVKGCFGLESKEQEGIFELGRLVKHPDSSIILSQFVAAAKKHLKENMIINLLLHHYIPNAHQVSFYLIL